MTPFRAVPGTRQAVNPARLGSDDAEQHLLEIGQQTPGYVG